MIRYCLVEREQGLTIVEIADDQNPEDAARLAGGVLVDPGPYQSQEEAYEALLALEQELGDETSDTPDVGALEDRTDRPPT
jgi:hypothetical protein